MCSIEGTTDSRYDIETFCNINSFRGPDDSNTYIGRGVQFGQMYDNLLCLDDWVWKFFLLLYETGFWMATSGANALEIKFFRGVTYVDPWKYLHTLLHMSSAHILLHFDIRHNVCFQ